MFKKILQNPLIKNSSIVFAGSMTSNVMAWMYHLFVGRILGPAQYGELAALFSVFYIINVPANVLQNILIKFFSIIKAKKDYGQAKTLLQVTTKWTVVLIIIGFGCIVVIVPFVAKYLQIEKQINIVWLYLIFASFLISVGNGSALLGFQLFNSSSIYGNIGMFLRLFFGIVFSFGGVSWTLISNIISNIISYILSFIPLQFILNANNNPLILTKRRAIGYSIPSFFTTLGLTALFSQDVLLVKHFFSSHDAGIYAAASVLGKVIFFASSAIGAVLFPIVSERKELNKPYHEIASSGIFIIVIICSILTGTYFLFPHFVVLLFGSTFLEATPYIGLFAIFISFFSLSSILLYVLLALEKSIVSSIAIIAAVAQFIGININHGNLKDVIITNIIISIVLCIVLILFFQYEKKAK